ncbi:MAG: flagellar biosynthesis anti-sigma factor FlgM [Clostridiales bacterium]|nr:MAG: flagellar biosynthesis anti-sigma factor FlgM [Clostridiales bacterium]
MFNKVVNNYSKAVPKTAKASGIKNIQDKIEISDAAREVQVATKAFKELPDVRRELVDRLKVAIEEGTYKPDSEDIAKKMMSLYNRD